MVEEIITALSQIRWLFVIARNSTFTYKGRAVDVKQVGRELGVRYVLEGSVRKAGGRVRITGQLIDALTGTHLWASRFDGSLEDIFELQDKVAVSVAGVIEPALQAAEMCRSVARPTTDLGAYDLYLRALATFFPVTKERALVSLAVDERLARLALRLQRIEFLLQPLFGRFAGVDRASNGSAPPRTAARRPCHGRGSAGSPARPRLVTPKNRGPDQCAPVIRLAITLSER